MIYANYNNETGKVVSFAEQIECTVVPYIICEEVIRDKFNEGIPFKVIGDQIIEDAEALALNRKNYIINELGQIDKEKGFRFIREAVINGNIPALNSVKNEYIEIEAKASSLRSELKSL